MKKTKKILILGVILLMMCGCSKEYPTLSDGSEAVITFSDVEDISANELYEALKTDYGLSTLITLMDTKILEAEYPDDIEDAYDSAESTANAIVASYGEDYVTSYFGSVDSYINYIYLNTLQNLAILDYAKTLVDEDEVESYYEKNIYGDVTVYHILIETGVTDDTTSDEQTELENEAKNKIKDIIAQLDAADDKLETFKTLAAEYSDDDSTKDNGGYLGAINTGSLSSEYDELLESARNLNDGEYSTEIITTELGYHVIYRESSTEKESLEDMTDEIKETLAEELLEEDATIQITAMDELRKAYGMDILDEELEEQYSNYIANQIASAKSSS